MSKEKIYFISKILIIVILVILYYVFIGIPEYKNSIGSSDKIINKDNYYDMFELKINNLDFAFVVDKNMTINHIFFFTESSICLYNKNIENRNLNDGLKEIIKILLEKDILKNNSYLQIVTYENKALNDFKKSLGKVISKYSLTLNTTYNKMLLIDKVNELDLKNDNNPLLVLDLYSKDIISTYDEEYDEKYDNEDIVTEENSFDYAYNIYLKIEKYYLVNKDNLLDITLIPADNTGNIFPSKESYYKIENDKIYAYIKIDNYDYCFLGSIDNYKKGVC